MKKFLSVTFILALSGILVYAGGVEGTWNAVIETENGPWEFTVEYEVDGDQINGEFITDMGDLEFGPGKIEGKEFEYSFELDYVTYTHKGKLIKRNEILIESSSEENDKVTEITLTRKSK